MDFIKKIIKFPFKLMTGLIIGAVLCSLIIAVGSALSAVVGFVVMLYFTFVSLLDKDELKELKAKLKENK